MRVKEGEEAGGQVKTTPGAAGALIPDNSLGSLAAITHGNGLTTVGSSVPLSNIESDNKVSVADESSTSTLVAGLSVVVGPLGVVETPLKGNVAGHPLCHLGVLAVEMDLVTASRGEHGQRHERRKY